MKPEQQKELNRMIWRSRIRSIAPAVVLGGLLVGIIGYFYWPESVVSERVVLGTVSNWTLPQTMTGGGNASLTVLLEDGRTVVATSAGNRTPQVGQSITLVEREYASGRVSYTWN